MMIAVCSSDYKTLNGIEHVCNFVDKSHSQTCFEIFIASLLVFRLPSHVVKNQAERWTALFVIKKILGISSSPRILAHFKITF